MSVLNILVLHTYESFENHFDLLQTLIHLQCYQYIFDTFYHNIGYGIYNEEHRYNTNLKWDGSVYIHHPDKQRKFVSVKYKYGDMVTKYVLNRDNKHFPNHLDFLNKNKIISFDEHCKFDSSFKENSKVIYLNIGKTKYMKELSL